ncbi:MAG: Outer membrane autotransporter barrel domain protein [Candidatus Nomurabacteria bacterium GW2011_GWF2_40_31]|uniref:Outer membrane autotransporter barrel domain protein n=2 Tax=Candidatus Nomuraibacteriota TaxID=1752729 RepID=A0A837HSA2_9BACT|nr:MAG: Outer membrane autotransporter barrel domain protein [Candidatus Nomurabacteria bacterium GW2011_GWD2_39_12]KKR20641.1 MAG: Outer membrane autotransporter barrel domain protein [Candidatus Nomurabacteria bacterium GW2011_GWC2_39_41]KKR37430.1 MAG: Outer membrane autotransporter barrel domain protein [Candidatus Nomurabacteria bacterium GW2011_GWE2_40_10]KKR38678.1 MAG: Outer membrane autotransporter barrel domain protein [Candidatus Nomurabacteria bacterium GW2011_GWB1_40_11]KKR40403.1 
MFVLAFALFNFNLNFASALVGTYRDIPGCTETSNYSTTSGQSCRDTTAVAGCQTGYLFSPVTGQACGGSNSGSNNDSQDNSSTISQFNSVFKSSFRVGSKGNDVKILQQFLKDEGYYFGKIDGKYGKISARAVKDFQDDNNLTVISKPVSPQPPYVSASELVTCVFSSSTNPITTEVQCYGYLTPTTTSSTTETRFSFSCSGIGSCTTKVNGPINTSLTWLSSCEGKLNTTIDGKNENVYFCGSTATTVLSPNGGEVWQAGSTQTVRWNVGDSSISQVNLTLRRVGYTGATNDLYLLASNTGSVTFTLPSSYATGSYFLRIEKSDGTLLDESNSSFTISSTSAQPSNLTITTPSPLPNAKVGQSYSVNIEATGGVGSYIWALGADSSLPNGLSFTAGSSSSVITGTPTIAGTYTFTITATSGSQAVAKQFTSTVDPADVVITPAPTGCTPSQNSVAPTASINSVGSITITSPNGGECLTKGSAKSITWTNSSNINQISIMLKDSNGTGDWIAYNIPNTGSYSWNVSKWNTTNTQFKIEIIGYETGVGSVTEGSDNFFTVN